jgi:hypothetical protein
MFCVARDAQLGGTMNPASKSVLLDAVNKPIKGAISRLFGKPLRIRLGQRVLTFNKPGDFEFTLNGRVSVSFIKMVELLHRPAGSLRREALFLRLIEHQLLRVLHQCRAEPERIAELLRDIGLKGISTEYRWRAIFEALADGEAEWNEYRRIALIKYLQYLRSRRDALGIVYLHKVGKVLEEDDEIFVEAPATAHHSHTAPVQSANEAEHQPPGFHRLPKGKAIAVNVDSAHGTKLLLARHCFNLEAGEKLTLVDELGRRYPLEPRTNTIGRGLGNDITLGSDYRAVSRRHVTIEPLGNGKVRLTDLSALGTYVPAHMVAAA